MPLYTFRCRNCNYEFQSAHAMNEPHPEDCPGCGEKLMRQFDTPTIILKGGGFYSNDKKLTPVDPLDYNPDEDKPSDLKGY